MENQIKITKLQEQMKQVNEKLDDQGKKLDELNIKMDNGFEGLREEFKCYVTKEVYAIDMKNIDDKLGKQGGIWDFIFRTIGSIIIGAIFALILKGVL